MYHFIDLPKYEQQQRRIALDYYGTLAQLSVLVPLLAFQLIHASQDLQRAWTARNGGSDIRPASPSLAMKNASKPYRQFYRGTVRLRKVFWRIKWWAGERVAVWPLGELGTRGEVITAAVWVGWLGFVCFWSTGEDYMHLTRRFGIVAASQMPLLYLLAMKTPLSPVQKLLRQSHETLNTVHRLLGYTFMLFIFLHAGFFVNFYVQTGQLWAKLQRFIIICGVLGVLSLLTILVTSSAPMRAWRYRVFYVAHTLLAAFLLLLLWFHVSHARIYVYETVAIWVFGMAARSWKTHYTFSGTIHPIHGTNLVDITLQQRAKMVTEMLPGQHAYISLPGSSLSRQFRSNPFSIASVQSTDHTVRFIARSMKGNTAALGRQTHGHHTTEVFVEGPYGLANHGDHLLRSDRVLLVAGGAGASFIVPLYRQLLADLSPSAGSARRQRVTFVWAVRGLRSAEWALPTNQKERVGFLERLRMYVTGEEVMTGSQERPDDRGRSQDAARESTDQSFVEGSAPPGLEAGMELEEQHNPVLPSSATRLADVAIAGRPPIARLVEQVLHHGEDERVAVMVCGPASLAKATRAALTPWAASRDLWYWEERFAL